MPLLVILILVVVVFFLTIAFSVLLHELGHAIPAILLTKQKVEVFIGSLGDKNKSFKIKIGLLDIWFARNPFFWRYGMCRQMAKEIPLKSQMVFIAGGAIASLLAGITGLVCFIHFFEYKGLRDFWVFFTYYSLALFLISIIPRVKKNSAANGKIYYSDGYILRRLFKIKKFQREFDDAIKFYNVQQYEESSKLCEFLLNQGIDYVAVFQNGISASVLAKNHERALRLCNKYQAGFVLTENDYCNIGVAKLYNKMYTQAKADFDKSLALNPDNIYTLNNIAYNYILNFRCY